MNKSDHSLSLLCLFTLLFSTFSCRNGSLPKEGNDTELNDSDSVNVIDDEYVEETYHIKMGYYNFDKVKDLTLFFDSIINNHGTMIRQYRDEDPNHDVRLCISQIDKYRKGERAFYPDSLVSNCIGHLGGECAYVSNHYTGVDLTFSEWFMMCAAYYAPDITCLVQTQTPDHRAGFYNFGRQYNGNPWWSYIFLKQKKGFEVRRVGDDDMELTGVYQLEDKKHTTYYLFSNNFTTSSFWQELYMMNGNGIEKVLEIDKFPVGENEMSADVYFDTKEAIWYQGAWEETDVFHQIEDRQKMRLILDGKKSRYIMIQ